MKARTKRLEDIDPELVCCEEIAKRYEELAGLDLEITEPIFIGRAHCYFCRRLHPQLRYATVVGNPFGLGRDSTVSCIAFAVVDLDEGTEEKFTQFRNFVELGPK